MQTRTHAIFGHFVGTDDADDSWMKNARCRGMDPAFFFPVPGDKAVDVKAVCGQCPVRQECLEFRLATAPGSGFYADDGIWGGTDGNERKRLRGWKRK